MKCTSLANDLTIMLIRRKFLENKNSSIKSQAKGGIIFLNSFIILKKWKPNNAIINKYKFINS
jgi:hypothetical protein